MRHLNTCQHQTILHAKPPRAEDVFTFGPDLVEQLRRKADITNNQLREDQA